MERGRYQHFNATCYLSDPNNNSRASTRWLENGSYAKLKNLTFGYTFPQQWTSKAKIKALRLYVSFDNLCTITNYSGLDPEVGLMGLIMVYILLLVHICLVHLLNSNNIRL